MDQIIHEWIDNVKVLEDCLPQILFDPFLNNLSDLEQVANSYDMDIMVLLCSFTIELSKLELEGTSTKNSGITDSLKIQTSNS